MCDPRVNQAAISKILTEGWAVLAIKTMKSLHTDGLCPDVAANLVVSATLAVAASVQATFDATENREFNRDHVRRLLQGILANEPQPFIHQQNGQLDPSTLN